MKRYLLILGCALAITLTFLIVSQRPELAYSQGAEHGAFSTMKQGVDHTRHNQGSLAITGWINGTAQTILFTVIMILGLKNNRESRNHWTKIIVAAGVIYAVVYSALMYSYSVGDLETKWPLGLTRSAFLMIFGMWVSAFLFTVFYVVFFKKWIYNDEDAKKFEELKQRLKSGDDDG